MTSSHIKLFQQTRLIFLFLPLSTSSTSVQAQKIALVDINEVLESLPDYQEAQAEVDRIAAEWRQEISQEYDNYHCHWADSGLCYGCILFSPGGSTRDAHGHSGQCTGSISGTQKFE